MGSLDEQISRALRTLREARTAASDSPTAGTLHREERAEENLNSLLDYRYAVRPRSASTDHR